MTAITEVTDATFESLVLDESDTVLVKFWAEWCPPCTALTPVLEQIASEDHPGFRIVSVNADENPEAALRFRILGVPTMKVFRGGEVVKTVIGMKPAPALRAELAQFLG